MDKGELIKKTEGPADTLISFLKFVKASKIEKTGVKSGGVIFIFLIGQKTALNQRSGIILEVKI